MSVVSSTYSADNYTQVDGRRYVVETHTLSDGSSQVISYLAPASWTSAEYEATMLSRVSNIEESLAESEFNSLLNEEV